MEFQLADIIRSGRGRGTRALKCIFGYSYALAIARKMDPPEFVIRSHGTRYHVRAHRILHRLGLRGWRAQRDKETAQRLTRK